MKGDPVHMPAPRTPVGVEIKYDGFTRFFGLFQDFLRIGRPFYALTRHSIPDNHACQADTNNPDALSYPFEGCGPDPGRIYPAQMDPRCQSDDRKQSSP